MNKKMMGVYSVRERDKGRKSVWTRVGVAWPHNMGEGLNIDIEALPLNFDGKLVVLPQRKDEDAVERQDAANPDE